MEVLRSSFHLIGHHARVSFTDLKEHNHVFAHAPDFDFWTGCREFKDARSDVEP